MQSCFGLHDLVQRWKKHHESKATAKSVSEEEIEDVKVSQLSKELQKSEEAEEAEEEIEKEKDIEKQKDVEKQKDIEKEKNAFSCADLIMKLSACCKNDKLKPSLLKTSDLIYSLLCAKYMTYSTNKEKLTTITEIHREVSREHNYLEDGIREKHQILHNYKNQQRRMKDEKVWFKSKIAEYEEQRSLLKAKEIKMQQKMDDLHDECKADKMKLDELADELEVYLNEKETPPETQNEEEQDENELKALLTDITDSDVNLNGSPKFTKEKEVLQTQGQEDPDVTEPLTESLDKEQLEKHETDKEPIASGMQLGPKSQKRQKRSERNKHKTSMPESTIQGLICEDLISLQGCSDEEPLFPSFDVETLKKKTKTSCSKVTVHSESTISLFIPNCPCSKKLQNAIANNE